MTIFLYGAYGTGNLGDDLLLKGALLEHANEVVSVISYGKPFIDGLNDYIDHFDFIANPRKFLKKGDALFFAGGGLFWAPTHCADMLFVAQEAKKIGCRVEIKRIGAQGFHCNPEAVKELMKISDKVTVRDLNSVEILREYDITDKAEFLPDYVLTLKDYVGQKFIKKERKERKKIKIGINHSATPFYHDREHRKKTLNIYSAIANKYQDCVDFYYIPHTRHFKCIDQNDIVYGEHFWCASAGLIKPFDFPETIDGLLEIYSEMSGVIGWRYHMLVLGKIFDLEVAHLGSLGGHKYGAFSRENLIPQINFDLDVADILGSFGRWVDRLIVKENINRFDKF